MTKRRLPIGIQTFRKIREQNCYYVDKTPFIKALVDGGSHYFLSRPRRFGKSLFLDTLKEVFEGNQALFAGLAIHDDWDWSVRHPVLRLSFGSGNFKEPGYLNANLMAQLDSIEDQASVASSYATGPERFAHLLRTLHEQAGQPVVMLVDEYDKPILDALDVPEVAQANRDFLRGIYSVIKDRDAHVRFVFLTRVSKFSKVSLFAGLNNLRDITLEDSSSSHGRLDMALRFGGQVYLCEFKVVEMASEGAAMAQLQAKGYADKYRALSQPIHWVAVEFSRNESNIVAFEAQRAA